MTKCLVLLFLVIFTLISGILNASILDNNVLKIPQLDGRIVGGSVTTIDVFPWQVSLQTINGNHICGGAIINEELVVTAAHCLQSAKPDKLQVRVGSSFWNAKGKVVKVATLRYHPEFKAEVMMHDVALLHLAESLTFDSTIQPILMATETSPNGSASVVSGWGTTSFGSETLPPQLISVNVDIISRDVCASDVYGYGKRIKQTMICAAAAGKDACQGDSGGPLVSNGLLVGIVSWGYGCAEANFPGVYSDVAELRSWIEETAVSFLNSGNKMEDPNQYCAQCSKQPKNTV